jgi:hypothetical protein
VSALAWLKRLFQEPTEAEYLASVQGDGVEPVCKSDCGHRAHSHALDPRTGKTACWACVEASETYVRGRG